MKKLRKTFSEDAATAPKGGLLTSGNGSEKIAIDDLPPDVFFTIEHLDSGTISEPMVFTPSNNRKAVRILFLKEKIPPHQANLEQDYEKLHNMALNAKIATSLQEYLTKVQAQASIDVAPEYQHCVFGNDAS